jgi:hypothetical protein
MGKLSWLKAATLLFCIGTTSALAEDFPKLDRTVHKEPAYKGKPRYCRVALGTTANAAVWLVHDGEALYVDRLGDGNLTGAGCKIAAEVRKNRALEGRLEFKVPELTIAGRVHKNLIVYLLPIKDVAEGSAGRRAEVQAALSKNADGFAAYVSMEVEVPGLKGAGIGGRVRFLSGGVDLTGVLVFGDSPSEAPILHFGGPLQVTFYSDRPTLRVGRSTDLVLVVGTPGVGRGTFAMVGYEDTIPESARPIAEIAFPSTKPGGAPVLEKFEIPERC